MTLALFLFLLLTIWISFGSSGSGRNRDQIEKDRMYAEALAASQDTETKGRSSWTVQYHQPWHQARSRQIKGDEVEPEILEQILLQEQKEKSEKSSQSVVGFNENFWYMAKEAVDLALSQDSTFIDIATVATHKKVLHIKAQFPLEAVTSTPSGESVCLISDLDQMSIIPEARTVPLLYKKLPQVSGSDAKSLIKQIKFVNKDQVIALDEKGRLWTITLDGPAAMVTEERIEWADWLGQGNALSVLYRKKTPARIKRDSVRLYLFDQMHNKEVSINGALVGCLEANGENASANVIWLSMDGNICTGSYAHILNSNGSLKSGDYSILCSFVTEHFNTFLSCPIALIKSGQRMILVQQNSTQDQLCVLVFDLLKSSEPRTHTFSNMGKIRMMGYDEQGQFHLVLADGRHILILPHGSSTVIFMKHTRPIKWASMANDPSYSGFSYLSVVYENEDTSCTVYRIDRVQIVDAMTYVNIAYAQEQMALGGAEKKGNGSSSTEGKSGATETTKKQGKENSLGDFNSFGTQGGDDKKGLYGKEFKRILGEALYDYSTRSDDSWISACVLTRNNYFLVFPSNQSIRIFSLKLPGTLESTYKISEISKEFQRANYLHLIGSQEKSSLITKLVYEDPIDHTLHQLLKPGPETNKLVSFNLGLEGEKVLDWSSSCPHVLLRYKQRSHFTLADLKTTYKPTLYLSTTRHKSVKPVCFPLPAEAVFGDIDHENVYWYEKSPTPRLVCCRLADFKNDKHESSSSQVLLNLDDADGVLRLNTVPTMRVCPGNHRLFALHQSIPEQQHLILVNLDPISITKKDIIDTDKEVKRIREEEKEEKDGKGETSGNSIKQHRPSVSRIEVKTAFSKHGVTLKCFKFVSNSIHAILSDGQHLIIDQDGTCHELHHGKEIVSADINDSHCLIVYKTRATNNQPFKQEIVLLKRPPKKNSAESSTTAIFDSSSIVTLPSNPPSLLPADGLPNTLSSNNSTTTTRETSFSESFTSPQSPQPRNQQSSVVDVNSRDGALIINDNNDSSECPLPPPAS